nr:TS-1 [Portieria hornemannii]
MPPLECRNPFSSRLASPDPIAFCSPLHSTQLFNSKKNNWNRNQIRPNTSRPAQEARGKTYPAAAIPGRAKVAATAVPLSQKASTMPSSEEKSSITLALEARPKLDFYLKPFPPAINNYHEEMRYKCLERCVQFGMIPDTEKAKQNFLSFHLERLAARFYPHCTKEQLEIGVDHIYFIFVYDDMCDNQDCTDPQVEKHIREIEERVWAILAGEPKLKDEEEKPLAKMMHFILQRCAEFGRPEWIEQYRTVTKKYMEGVRWERNVRNNRERLTLPKYDKIRGATVAATPCMALSVVFHCQAPQRVKKSCYVDELFRSGSSVVAWVNDVYTVWKDIRDKTSDNVVLVLVNSRELSWKEALNSSIQLVDEEMENLLALERNVAGMIGGEDPGIVAIIKAVNDCVRGNYDWSIETPRYRDVKIQNGTGKDKLVVEQRDAKLSSK